MPMEQQAAMERLQELYREKIGRASCRERVFATV